MERTNAFVVKWRSGRNGDNFHGFTIHGILMDTEERCSLSSQFFIPNIVQKWKVFCNRKSQTKILKLKLKQKVSNRNRFKIFLQPKSKTETESLWQKLKKKFTITQKLLTHYKMRMLLIENLLLSWNSTHFHKSW